MSSYRPKTKIDDNGTIADLPLDAETLGSYNKTDIRDGVIFYTSTGTAAKTSSPYTASLWDVTIDDRFPTELYTGLTILMKVPVAGNSNYGVLMTVDGGTTYHPVCRNTNTNISTAYAVGCILILTYDATQTATAYYNSTSAVTYTGVWKIADYDANTTITYGTLAYYLRPYTSAALYRYKLCMLNKDNKLVPLILTNNSDSSAKTDMTPTSEAFRPDKIYWYNTTTTVNANAVVGANTLMSNGYNATNMPRCNFNASLTTYKMIYLCGTYNTTTGLFTLRGGGTAGSTQYYVFVPNNTSNITLSSYFTSGYDYILVGASYSTANYMHLREDHPMYHFDGTNLVPYDTYRANSISSSIPTVDYPVTDVKVNNTSVVSSKVANITVPTKVSDLTNDSGYITGITSSDVTSALGYTPGTSNLTIGTTASTAAKGNHVHSVTATGNVSSTFTGTATTSGAPSNNTTTVASSTHTHDFTPSGSISLTPGTAPSATTRYLSSTVSGSTAANTSTTTVLTGVSIVGTVSGTTLTLSISTTDTNVASSGHSHSISSATVTHTANTSTATGRVAYLSAFSAGTTPPASASFSGDDNTTESPNGTGISVPNTSHTHSVTATGNVSSTFTGTDADSGVPK